MVGRWIKVPDQGSKLGAARIIRAYWIERTAFLEGVGAFEFELDGSMAVAVLELNMAAIVRNGSLLFETRAA